MAEALAGMMNEEIEAIQARYRNIASYYADLIETRAERDRRFLDARRKAQRTIGAP